MYVELKRIVGRPIARASTIGQRAIGSVVAISLCAMVLGHSTSRADTSSSCALNSPSVKTVSSKALAGLYVQPSGYREPDGGSIADKSRLFNYLAITPVRANVIHLQLRTAERNGHDCRIDSLAMICGSRITLQPNEEEAAELARLQRGVPQLAVTSGHISFMRNPDGGYTWGTPYCGAMGYLTHQFLRSSRRTSFDPNIFQ